MGTRRPSAPRPQPCPLSQLGRSAPRPRRNNGPKQASGSCILQRESLLRQPTTAPTPLGSGKQRKPFSPLALRSPEGKAGRGCLCLPGPCCFAVGLRCPKPTPHGFSLAGKQDWVREVFLGPGRSHATRASSAGQRDTQARVQGITGSRSCPGTLALGSERPRGRPAVPGDSGPAPNSCGVDQLFQATCTCVRGPSVSPCCPRLSGPVPMAHGVDQLSLAIGARVQRPSV